MKHFLVLFITALIGSPDQASALFDEPNNLVLEEPADSIFTWTLIKSSETVQAETGGINFVPRAFAYNRENGDLYLVNNSSQQLLRYRISENLITEIPSSNWFSNASELVFNPSDNHLYSWRSGLDNVYRIPIEGGEWEQVASGGFDAYRYGANSYYNGVSENCGAVHGYGWYQYRRDANEIANGQWNQVIPNSSGVEPYKRSTTVLPNADYTELILIDGSGNTNGDQWQSNCDIPGGLNWASDIGKWCWLRDLWKLDLATMTYTNVLPLNSDFEYTGVFGYDYTRDEYYRFGGFVPAAVYGQAVSTTNAAAKLNFSGEPSWVELSVQGDIPPQNAGGRSFYIEDLDQFLIFNSHGIWRFEFPDAIPPIPGCTDELACNFNLEANVDDGSCLTSGCMDAEACNYNAEAECEGEACDYACCPGPSCCDLGTVWSWESQTCVIANLPYLNEPGETANINPCYFDTNYDGMVEVTDLMNLLSVYGMSCFWECGNLVSHQGYDYQTVQIGDQCWFAENLSYIPEGEAALTEGNVSTPAAYTPVGDEDAQIYYNHYATLEWDLCPTGWHVPSLDEWEMSIAVYEDGSLSVFDAEGWGITLDGYWDGAVLQAGAQATLWSTDINPENGWGVFQNFINSGNQYSGSSERESGATIRCIQD